MAHSIYILLDGTTPKDSTLTEAISNRLNWLCEKLRKSSKEYRLAVFSYATMSCNTLLALTNVKEILRLPAFHPQVGFRSLGTALVKVAVTVAKDRKNFPDDTRHLYVVSHGIPMPKLNKTELDEKFFPCGFNKKTVILIGNPPVTAPREYQPLTPNIFQSNADELFSNVLSDVGLTSRRFAPPILGNTIRKDETASDKKATSPDIATSLHLPSPAIPTLKPKKSKTPPPLPPAASSPHQDKEPECNATVKPPSPSARGTSSVEAQLLKTQNQALLEKVQKLESQLAELSAQSVNSVSLVGLTARNNELTRQLGKAQAKAAEQESALAASRQENRKLQEALANSKARSDKTSPQLVELQKSLAASQQKQQENEAAISQLTQELTDAQNKQNEAETKLAEQVKAFNEAQKKLSEASLANETLTQQLQEQSTKQKEQVSLLANQAGEQRAWQDKYHQAETSLKELEKQLAEAKALIAKQETTLTEQKQTSKSQISERDQKITELEQKLRGQSSLQTELEMTKQMWTQAQDFNKNLQSQVEGLKRILDTQKQKLAALEETQSQAQKLETTLSDNQQELDKLRQEHSTLKKEYETLLQKHTALQQDLETLKTTCEPYLQGLARQKEEEERRLKRKAAEQERIDQQKQAEREKLFGLDDFPPDE